MLSTTSTNNQIPSSNGIGAPSLFEKSKHLKYIFRIVSITLIYVLITTLLSAEPIDLLFILMFESAAYIVVMLLSFLFTFDLKLIIIGTLTSAVLVPILVLFLWVVFMLISVIFILGAEGEETAFPLINYGIQIADGDFLSGVWNIKNHFGTDLYWIFGSLLAHHFFFDLSAFYRRDKTGQDLQDIRWALFGRGIIKALTSSTKLMLLSFVLVIPLSIVVFTLDDQHWSAYVVALLFRMGYEWRAKEVYRDNLTFNS